MPCCCKHPSLTRCPAAAACRRRDRCERCNHGRSGDRRLNRRGEACRCCRSPLCRDRRHEACRRRSSCGRLRRDRRNETCRHGRRRVGAIHDDSAAAQRECDRIPAHVEGRGAASRAAAAVFRGDRAKFGRIASSRDEADIQRSRLRLLHGFQRNAVAPLFRNGCGTRLIQRCFAFFDAFFSSYGVDAVSFAPRGALARPTTTTSSSSPGTTSGTTDCCGHTRSNSKSRPGVERTRGLPGFTVSAFHPFALKKRTDGQQYGTSTSSSVPVVRSRLCA